MNPWFLLCCGAGLACWPRAAPGTTFSWRPPRVVRGGWWLPPAVLAVGILGFGGALATMVLMVTGRQEYRHRVRMKAALAEAELTASVLRTMVGELRAGAHPVTAAEAAAEAVPSAAGRLHGLISAARLDGEPSSPEAPPALVNAWTLASRFGLPMAEVLDAARRDVETGIAFGRRLKAKMAGPRASAAVLAALPLICVLFGQAMGADPVRVFTATGAGQVLLVLGSVLIWAGTAWCRMLTARVSPC